MGNAQRKAAHQPPRASYVPSAAARKVHWDGPGLPTPPGKPILIPGEEDSQPDVVGIRWERSPFNGGSAIIGYHVEHRKMGSANWVRSAPVLCTFPELTLSGLEPGWRYQFRIRAQNALGLSEPSELSDPLTVTLQRAASLSPKFDIELKDCVSLEGEQAEFTVHYQGTPLPKVSWFKDGFEIFSSRRTTITTDSAKSVLIIHKTSIDDEGEIKCSATNRAGHISTRAKLIIEAPPHVRLPRQYDEGLLFEQGETIRLKATNGGRPPPSITWYHNGEIIIVDQRHHFESITDNETILKIQDAKRQDRGEYSIRAINKLGDDVASFLVTVTDRPAAPTKTVVTGTMGKSVTLAWKEPDDDGGCKIGTYIVEYYRLGWDVWLKAATCRQTIATLNDLIEGSEYRFRVKAENPYGVSEPSEESNVVFIPDPKRGITEPNMRAKSASHRDIPRGRSEKRDVNFGNEPAQRTRSLTREEATAGREGGYERTASSQRLPMPTQRPSRSDSRVTFALDAEDEESAKRHSPKEPPIQNENHGRNTLQQAAVVVRQTFDGSGGSIRRSFLESRSHSISFSREQSPAVFGHNANTTEVERLASPTPVPRRRRSSSEIRETTVDIRVLRSEDEEEMIHDSSEFMLVLYPGETKGNITETSNINQRDKAAHQENLLSRIVSSSNPCVDHETNETSTNLDEDDLVPPPMSLSLPELFSPDHQIVEIIREAVSSTELLHERAMERFYRAVEAEKSQVKSQPANMNLLRSSKGSGEPEPYPLFNARTRPVRRRLSNSGANATTWQLKRDRRRSSEGQAKVMMSKAPSVNPMNVLEIVSSDPNLLLSKEVLTQKADVCKLGDSTERLRRWHEPGIDLSNELSVAELIEKENQQNNQKEELLKLPEINIKGILKLEEEYDEVAPDTDEILAEDSVETSGVSSEGESSDSEHLKHLKARIMSIPVMDEEDTYHPKGRMVMHSDQESPPPVPPHRVPFVEVTHPLLDRTNLSPTNLTPASSNNAIVPKSILKKRTDTEPIPVNQFGRPIPPEKPIRKSLPAYDDTCMDFTSGSRSLSNLNFSESPTTQNKNVQSSITPKTLPRNGNTNQTEADLEKEAVISAGEAAVTKRRQMRHGSKTLLSSEGEEEQEEKMAVVSHYTEIVKQYSHPEFRQRSLSQDRDIKQYESPSESRVTSPAPSDINANLSNNHKERLPSTPGKIITPIPPVVPQTISNSTLPAKIITPIPPVIPLTPIQKAKPISPAEQNLRRGSLTNCMNSFEPEINVTRGRTRKQEPSNESRQMRKSSVNDSRSPSPIRWMSDSRPSSRTESPMPKSRNVSRDRASSVAMSCSSTGTRGNESKSMRSNLSSRPSSRCSSIDRSGANTPTELRMDRLQRALEDKRFAYRRASTKEEAMMRNAEIKKVLMELETEHRVRSIMNYIIDVGLLMVAVYVYLFKKEVLAIPIIALILYRHIQEEISGWISSWRKREK